MMRMMGNMTRKRVILMPRMERELRIMRTTTMITRTDAKHTIVVPNIFPYMILHIEFAASLAMPAKTQA